MSCIGIDIGQQNAVVAIARRGGIDVLSNEVSKRLTASMVGFSGKERKLGEAALSGITSNLKNTVTGVKAVLGKKFHSEDVQKEIDLVGYKMVDVAGKVGIPVQYNEEEVMLTPERAMSMVFKCMQKIAELDQGTAVTDVVVAVPTYFTDAERHAMLDAASIAGLNCLRLMNDITAAALSYGIYKTDMPADKPVYVAFVDMGAMDTSVSIVSFVKGKLTVLSTACDRTLGGRDFDMILAEHFAAEWKEKHKIDAKTNKKAMYRLVTACEKTKKILSANPQAPINIECFMDDIDVKGMMERDEMLTVGAPLLARLDGILDEAFKASGLTMEDINSVEVLGGSVRIPAVHDRVAAFFKKETCSKTLNFDECVAKGCALQCAMLSPAFKVRDFSVTDVTMYPIALSWSSTGGAEKMEVEGDAEDATPSGNSTVVFSKFNAVPCTKMLTFYRKETFSLTAAYDSSVTLPNGFPTKLAEFTVSDIPPRAANEDGKVEPAKIKVKLRLDLHGLLTLESAVAIEEQEVIEEVKPEPAPAAAEPPPLEGDAAAPPAEGEAAAAGEAPKEGEAAAEAAPAPEPEKKKTKKVKRVALGVGTKGGGITSQELMEAQEAEGNMAHMDKLIAETSEAMNALESNIYSLRSAISDRLSAYLVDADKEAFGAKLTAMEDWLYDEGFDADKATYEAKLKELTTAFAGGEGRALEADKRPDAIAMLERAIEVYTKFATSSEEEYAHIAADEKQKVATEAAAAQAWLSESRATLDALAKTADPPIKAADISAKATALSSVCEPIKNTPKPLPPKPEPAPAAEEPAAAEAEGAAEPVAEGAEPKAEGGAKPDNMDVD